MANVSLIMKIKVILNRSFQNFHAPYGLYDVPSHIVFELNLVT